LVYLTIFYLIHTLSFAQQDCDNVVIGSVKDLKTGENLPFATVVIEGTQKGTIADLDGLFTLDKICEEEVELIVSYLGYKNNHHHHDLHHGNPIIYLAPEGYSLESVVIEADALNDSRVGQLSTRLDLDKISTANNSLGEVLAELSGVEMISTGQNVTKPVIHGLHSNRILIINDDLRHEFQNWGVDHAPEIDPEQFESIEVIKGAATVKYGPDALDGVILMRPRKLALHERLNGFVKTSAFSNGRGGSLSTQLNAGSHQFSGTAGFSKTVQGDLKSPNYILTNTGKKETSFNAGLRYHLPKLDLELRGGYFAQELGILRGSNTGNIEDLIKAIESDVPLYTQGFDYAIAGPKQEVNHTSIKLKGKYFLPKAWLEVTYGIQINNRFEFDVRRGTNNQTPAIDLSLISQSFDVDYFHPKIFGLEGNIGVSALIQDNNNNPGTNTIPFVPNYNVTRFGLYVIENLSLGNVLLEFGGRYDWQMSSIRGRDSNNDVYFDNINFNNLSTSIGLEYGFRQHIFRTNIASAWRPPSISELYSFGRHQAAIEYGFWRFAETTEGLSTSELLTQDNKPVKSELRWKWINSLSLESENISMEIVLYVNFIKNYIYATPRGITSTVRGTFPYWIYTQEDALFMGGDFSLNIRHGNHISSTFSMAYVHAQNLYSEAFVGIPPANFKYRLSQAIDMASGQLTISVNPSYTFRQFNEPTVIELSELLLIAQRNEAHMLNEMEVFDIAKAPEGYFLLNSQVNYDLKSWSFSLSGSNMLNNSYRNYTDRLPYIADDRGCNVQLEVKFNI
jgi:iron complex outermembrane receptor protein